MIATACDTGVTYLSLSYVRNLADIEQAYALLKEKKNSQVRIIAKVETASAMENLDEILQAVPSVNVDRGDLSTDIGVIEVSDAQDKVVKAALAANRRVFLATQFLKNMEIHNIPLISEVTALHDAIKNGISGIQLSEETAVGKYPIECVKLVFDVLHYVHSH